MIFTSFNYDVVVYLIWKLKPQKLTEEVITWLNYILHLITKRYKTSLKALLKML